jgi:hypothetical protein
MPKQTTAKRSEHELKRLVEDAVAEEFGLNLRGLWLCVDKVEAIGCPPEKLKVWATLHFLAAGSPFCCGEPLCHLPLIKRGEDVNEHVRRALQLRQPINVDFGNRIGINYHDAVRFTN